MGALKNLATTALAAVQTRLALLANEVQIEKHRALRQLVLALAFAFSAGLTVLLAVALAVVLWWDQRLWIIGGCALLGLGATVWCVAALRNSTRPADPMFSASLAELQEDLRQLKAASGRE